MKTQTRKKEPRDISTVIEAMLKALPDEQAELRARLKRLLDKIGYTPPEAIRDRWIELTTIFNEALFGADRSAWDRTKAPTWSVKAGLILADEAR